MGSAKGIHSVHPANDDKTVVKSKTASHSGGSYPYIPSQKYCQGNHRQETRNSEKVCHLDIFQPLFPFISSIIIPRAAIFNIPHGINAIFDELASHSPANEEIKGGNFISQP
jgi:hypothetical protein